MAKKNSWRPQKVEDLDGDRHGVDLAVVDALIRVLDLADMQGVPEHSKIEKQENIEELTRGDEVYGIDGHGHAVNLAVVHALRKKRRSWRQG